MHDSLRMSRIEGIGDLHSEIQDFPDIEWLASNQVLQRLSLQQLHGDEVLAVRFVNFMDRADVGMIERGRSKCFALKSLPRSGIVLHIRGKKFQRDMPMQLKVLGFVHHTHTAATELLQDSIVRDGLADHLTSVAVRRRSSSKKFSRKITWF